MNNYNKNSQYELLQLSREGNIFFFETIKAQLYIIPDVDTGDEE